MDENNFTINTPAWQQWAYAITQGVTLARRKWTGKNRPFRQAEYETGRDLLCQYGILRKNGEGDRATYRPNRAGGWEYIQAMAHGLKTLPTPPALLRNKINLPNIRHFHQPAKNQAINLLSGDRLVTGGEVVDEDPDSFTKLIQHYQPANG